MRVNNVFNYISYFKDLGKEILPKLQSSIIEEVYHKMIPTDHQTKEIFSIISLIKSQILTKAEYEIYAWGSATNGLFLKSSSDIDFILPVDESDNPKVIETIKNKIIRAIRSICDHQQVNFHILRK